MAETHAPSGSAHPASARSVRLRCPSPARTRCSCGPSAPASAGAPRPWSSGARCRRASTRVMRAPFQEGDFPGPVKYGYLNVGVVEQARRRCSGGPSSACTRIRPPTSCRPARWSPYPTTCRRSERCWPAPWRPRLMRCGTPPRWSVIGSRWSAPGWSAAASRAMLAGSPGSGSNWSTSTPTRAAVAAALGVEFAAPARGGRAGATWSSTPAPRRPGCTWSLDLLAPEGTVRRAELVRRPRGEPGAGRVVPLGTAAHPEQPGRYGRPRPGGRSRSFADRLALALDLLRDPAFDTLLYGRVTVRASCRRCSPPSPPAPAPHCPTSSPTAES